MLIHRTLVAAMVFICLLTACGGGKKSTATGTATAKGSTSVELPGKVLVTGEATLDLYAGGRRTPIARAPNSSVYFEYPTFSPDGQRVAYVTAITPTAKGQDWGNDIYTANVDGNDAKLVLKHDQPGALVDSLSWSPDGNAVIFAYSRTLYDDKGHYTGQIYQVDRMVLADGSRTTLLNNAIQPSLSADGKQIIYVDYPQNDFQTPSLAIANIDGSGPHKLLTDQKGFQGFFAPHLSPDGKCMAFAAVGGPLSAPSSSATPSINEEPPPALQTLQTVGAILRDGIDAPAALADGLIWQVWTACIDGSKLHALGNLREDYPYPLWSADGKSILFLGSGGLYLIGADGTNLKRLGDGVSHGEIAWYQK